MPLLTEATSVARGPSAESAAAPATPAPVTLRNLRRAILSTDILLVRVPEIRKFGQQVGVSVCIVMQRRAVGYEAELDVDHVVGERPPVEEATGVRVVVGQNIRQQDLGDRGRLVGTVGAMSAEARAHRAELNQGVGKP